MQEIEITKFIIKVEDSNPNGEKADLIGFDKDGNEYTFQYWDGIDGSNRKLDIICTQAK